MTPVTPINTSQIPQQGSSGVFQDTTDHSLCGLQRGQVNNRHSFESAGIRESAHTGNSTTQNRLQETSDVGPDLSPLTVGASSQSVAVSSDGFDPDQLVSWDADGNEIIFEGADGQAYSEAPPVNVHASASVYGYQGGTNTTHNRQPNQQRTNGQQGERFHGNSIMQSTSRGAELLLQQPLAEIQHDAGNHGRCATTNVTAVLLGQQEHSFGRTVPNHTRQCDTSSRPVGATTQQSNIQNQAVVYPPSTMVEQTHRQHVAPNGHFGNQITRNGNEIRMEQSKQDAGRQFHEQQPGTSSRVMQHPLVEHSHRVVDIQRRGSDQQLMLPRNGHGNNVGYENVPQQIHREPLQSQHEHKQRREINTNGNANRDSNSKSHAYPNMGPPLTTSYTPERQSVHQEQLSRHDTRSLPREGPDQQFRQQLQNQEQLQYDQQTHIVQRCGQPPLSHDVQAVQYDAHRHAYGIRGEIVSNSGPYSIRNASRVGSYGTVHNEEDSRRPSESMVLMGPHVNSVGPTRFSFPANHHAHVEGPPSETQRPSTTMAQKSEDQYHHTAQKCQSLPNLNNVNGLSGNGRGTDGYSAAQLTLNNPGQQCKPILIGDSPHVSQTKAVSTAAETHEESIKCPHPQRIINSLGVLEARAGQKRGISAVDLTTDDDGHASKSSTESRGQQHDVVDLEAESYNTRKKVGKKRPIIAHVYTNANPIPVIKDKSVKTVKARGVNCYFPPDLHENTVGGRVICEFHLSFLSYQKMYLILTDVVFENDADVCTSTYIPVVTGNPENGTIHCVRKSHGENKIRPMLFVDGNMAGWIQDDLILLLGLTGLTHSIDASVLWEKVDTFTEGKKFYGKVTWKADNCVGAGL